MYICIYTHTHISTHITYIYKYIYIYIYIYIYVYKCIHLHVYIYIYRERERDVYIHDIVKHRLANHGSASFTIQSRVCPLPLLVCTLLSSSSPKPCSDHCSCCRYPVTATTAVKCLSAHDYYTIPYYYYTILYDTMIYYTILYYTILYYTILYYNTSAGLCSALNRGLCTIVRITQHTVDGTRYVVFCEN